MFFLLLTMIWQAWSTDHMGEKSEVTTAQEQSEKTNAVSTKKQHPHEVAVVDIPDKHRFINIKTDVLNITLDKVGGKVVDAGLSDYHTSKTNPAPEKILTSKKQNTYFALSGISGDANLIYSTNYDRYVLSKKSDQMVIVLMAKNEQGIEYEKTYTFHRGKYDIQIMNQITNKSKDTWRGESYVKLRGETLTNLDNRSAPKPKEFVAGAPSNGKKGGMFTFTTYTGPAYFQAEKPYTKASFEEIAKKKLNKEVNGGWIAIQKRYFITALIPDETNTHMLHSTWSAGRSQTNQQDFLQQFSLSMTGPQLSISPNESYKSKVKLYVGPEISTNLAPLAKGIELTVDYGWLWFISNYLFIILAFIQKYTRSWGAAIILITLLIKMLFYKLSETQYKSMARLRKLQPRIQSIQERYKDDAAGKNKAMIELYKKEKANPLGGCLPMIIPIPFFIALYYVLIESVQLRLEGFLWIPDLSSADPFYILPILMGIGMLLQTKLNPTPADPAQAKMQMILPVVFTVMFSQFPAGLVLYWFVNNTLSFVQQWYITRKLGVKVFSLPKLKPKA